MANIFFKSQWLRISFVFIVCILNVCLYAQTPILKKYPDTSEYAGAVILKNIKYYARQEIQLKELKGKPVILDFFSSGCAYCFSSLPHVNTLRKQFEGKLEIIMVGKEDGKIQKSYEVYRKKYQLTMPVSFDSALFRQFVPWYVPYLIWIDSSGVISAITSGPDLIEMNIKKFIANEPFEYHDASLTEILRRERFFDSLDRACKADPADTTLLFESVLKLSKEGTPPLFPSSITDWCQYNSSNKICFVQVYLPRLYMYAYAGSFFWSPGDSLYGKFSMKPVLETKDSSAILKLNKYSQPTSYVYYVTIPRKKATATFVQQVMQKDLQQYFGYDVRTEERMTPCLKLINKNKNKQLLASKKKNQPSTYSKSGFSLKNMQVSSLVELLASYLKNEPPIFDETGIGYNIDIQMSMVESDLEGTRKELNRYGLDLIPGTTIMKVLVISDPKH